MVTLTDPAEPLFENRFSDRLRQTSFLRWGENLLRRSFWSCVFLIFVPKSFVRLGRNFRLSQFVVSRYAVVSDLKISTRRVWKHQVLSLAVKFGGLERRLEILIFMAETNRTPDSLSQFPIGVRGVPGGVWGRAPVDGGELFGQNIELPLQER